MLQSLGDVFSAFAAALGAADKVVEMIQREPQLPGAGSLRPEALAGRLELRDVSFAYPTRPGVRVLNAISLKVNPGQVRGRRAPGRQENAQWSVCDSNAVQCLLSQQQRRVHMLRCCV